LALAVQFNHTVGNIELFVAIVLADIALPIDGRLKYRMTPPAAWV
jgi:hypothetical protein